MVDNIQHIRCGMTDNEKLWEYQTNDDDRQWQITSVGMPDNAE